LSAVPRSKLTSREYDVLSAVNEGLSNNAITRRLNIKATTVRSHLVQLFDKLGASSRLELAVFARHHRVLESSELESSDLNGLGFSLTTTQTNLILRAINGRLREEDVEPARRLADIIASRREEITEMCKRVREHETQSVRT
jgi:DNA-binding CsgD family transcriptional regulator